MISNFLEQHQLGFDIARGPNGDTLSDVAVPDNHWAVSLRFSRVLNKARLKNKSWYKVNDMLSRNIRRSSFCSTTEKAHW